MEKVLKTDFNFDSDQLIELLDETPYWSAPFGIKLLENIVIRKNITALDIGFGTGFPLTEIAMRLGKQSKVYGIDPWQAAINRAQKKLAQYGIENVEIIVGKAENITLENESVDLITSNNGINNVDDIDKVIEECARISKTGAQFIQTVNLEGSMIEFYNLFKQEVINANLPQLVHEIDAHIHKKRMPLPEFRHILEKHNFEIKNIIHDQFTYTFADGDSFFNHYFIRLAFFDSWKNIVPEEKQLNIFSSIKTKVDAITAKDGNFKLTIPFVVIDARKK